MNIKASGQFVPERKTVIVELEFQPATPGEHDAVKAALEGIHLVPVEWTHEQDVLKGCIRFFPGGVPLPKPLGVQKQPVPHHPGGPRGKDSV